MQELQRSSNTRGARMKFGIRKSNSLWWKLGVKSCATEIFLFVFFYVRNGVERQWWRESHSQYTQARCCNTETPYPSVSLCYWCYCNILPFTYMCASERNVLALNWKTWQAKKRKRREWMRENWNPITVRNHFSPFAPSVFFQFFPVF